MLGLHPVWAILILVVILIVFGVGKLPSVGGALGRGIKDFKRSTKDENQDPSGIPKPPDPTAD